MQKYADYIKQIEIDSLWSGTKHILWNLDRRVNILSGVNGVGKSTILNKVVKGLAAGGEFPSHMIKGVHLKVEPEEAKWIRYDVIRSVDRPLMNAEMINKIDLTLVTELDWQLFQLQRKYLDYQVNIGNRDIRLVVLHQHGKEDGENLLLTSRELIRREHRPGDGCERHHNISEKEVLWLNV